LWQRNFHVRNGPDRTATKLQRCEYVVCASWGGSLQFPYDLH
jgi:hypothetical protein